MRARPSLQAGVSDQAVPRANRNLQPWPCRRIVLVDKRLIGPAFRNILIERNGCVEIVEGIVVVAERHIGNAATVIRFRRRGIERNCLEKSLDGLLVLALGLIDQAAIMVGATVGGLQGNSLIEVAERLIKTTGLTIDIAAPDIGSVILAGI